MVILKLSYTLLTFCKRLQRKSLNKWRGGWVIYFFLQEVPMLLARQNAASFVTPSGDFVIMGGYSNRAGYIDEVEIKYASKAI